MQPVLQLQGEQTAEQFRKIEYLNIIGNLGPLLGLLGTVLGMIEAFEAMHAAGATCLSIEANRTLVFDLAAITAAADAAGIAILPE